MIGGRVLGARIGSLESREAEGRAPSSLKRLGRLSLVYMVADTMSRGSAILLVPLYTHYLTPADYGVLALSSLIGSFVVMLLSFSGASVAVRFFNQFEDASQRDRFMATFWLFLVTVPGAVLLLLYFLAGGLVAALFRGLPLHPYLELILGTAYLNIAFGTLLPALFRAREQASRYVALAAGSMVITVALSVVFVAFDGRSAAGALQAQLLAALVVSAASAFIMLRDLPLCWRPRELRAALSYGLPLVPHFAAHWTLSISDRGIVERFAGIGSVGVYSLAYQFGTVLQMMLTSVNGALGPSFSRAAKDHAERATLARVTTYFYLAVAVLGLGIALCSRGVILALTPQSYHGAVDMVPFIALGVSAMGLYFIPMNLLSMTAGRTRFIPVITLFAGGLNVALNLVLVPRFGATAAAVNTAVGYSALALLTTLYARRVIPMSYEWGRIARIAASSGLVYLLGRLLDGLSPLANLGACLVLVASFPLVLLLLGFWSAEEKRRSISLVLGLLSRS